MNSIDVYQYVASNNPRAARRIIESFGYNIRGNNLAQNLRDLVNNEGEDVVVEIMKYHPDAEYFSEMHSNFTGKKVKKKPTDFSFEKYAYLNAIGNNNQSTFKSDASANQTNTIILASAIILAIAIISKN